MPFTISHAAAVLPLRSLGRVRLPLAAMMIGSMSPDFAYFLPAEPDRSQTHNIAGVFLFCWPVGLALWLLFIRILELPTSALLPENWRSRFAPSDREVTFANLAWASFAVILGAMTHLVWDAFTHKGTDVVAAIPALGGVAFRYAGWRIHWYVVLQFLSSIAGLLALMVWAWRLPSGRYPRPTLPSVPHATRVLCATILVAASSVLAVAGYVLNSETWLARRVFHFLIGGMTGWAIAWLAIALWIGARARTS